MLKVESLEAVREDTTGIAGFCWGVEVGGFEGKEGTKMVWFVVCLFGWLVGLLGWFVGWLVGWLVCLVGWLVCLVGWLVCLVGWLVCLVGFFVCLLCLLVRLLLGMSLPWVKPFTVKFR